MHIRLGAVAALALIVAATALAATAVAATADGFGAFWPTFQAAAARDDAKALASMIVLGPALGDDGASFARFHAGALGPKVRRCLAKTKPVRDVDPQGNLSYFAFCGEVVYVFSKTGGTWKLTDLGAND